MGVTDEQGATFNAATGKCLVINLRNILMYVYSLATVRQVRCEEYEGNE